MSETMSASSVTHEPRPGPGDPATTTDAITGTYRKLAGSIGFDHANITIRGNLKVDTVSYQLALNESTIAWADSGAISTSKVPSVVKFTTPDGNEFAYISRCETPHPYVFKYLVIYRFRHDSAAIEPTATGVWLGTTSPPPEPCV